MSVAPQLDDAARFLKDIPLEGAETVFLSGSVAEGWSSEGSNYNFYVIGKPPPGIRPIGGYSLPPDGTRVPGHHFAVGTARVIIRYWRPEDVSWAIAAVQNHELRPTEEIWPAAIEFLHRLSIGVPLHGAARFEELRSTLSVEMLAGYITQNRAMYAESFYTDAITRLNAGRHYDALLQARIAYECSIDAYLASQGETNPQGKWQHKKLLRVAPAGLLRTDFEQAMTGPGPSDDRGVDAYVSVLLQRSSTLNCCVQLGCAYSALTIDSAPGGDGPVVVRALGARLSRRYDGSALVIDLLNGAAVRLTPIAALVFGCADGRWSATQIAEHAAAHLRPDAAPGAVAADVAEVVHALSERGFLQEVTGPWPR